MGFAVYHLEKGSTSSGGIGNHIDRKEGAEHTYRHADPAKKKDNLHFKLSNGLSEIPLNEAIAERIKKGYNNKRVIRGNAVKYCTHILTGSHEDMIDIFSSEERRKEWINENYKFLIDEYGKENIVRFVCHLDEKTPHIHAVTVPLTEDGRLSAKEIIGNRKKMQERQDRYAHRMRKFGLERGIKNTGIKHESAREYYARISPQRENIDDLRDSKLLGLMKPVNEEKVLKKVSYLENEILNKEKKINQLKELPKELEKELEEYKSRAIQSEKALKKAKYEIQALNVRVETVRNSVNRAYERGKAEREEYLLQNNKEYNSLRMERAKRLLEEQERAEQQKKQTQERPKYRGFRR